MNEIFDMFGKLGLDSNYIKKIMDSFVLFQEKIKKIETEANEKYEFKNSLNSEVYFAELMNKSLDLVFQSPDFDSKLMEKEAVKMENNLQDVFSNLSDFSENNFDAILLEMNKQIFVKTFKLSNLVLKAAMKTKEFEKISSDMEVYLMLNSDIDFNEYIHIVDERYKYIADEVEKL